jgi:DNA-binding NarL/FixJ family response regulator
MPNRVAATLGAGDRPCAWRRTDPWRYAPSRASIDAMNTTVEKQAIRVVIADDAIVLREGAAMLLEDAGFEVVGQASDADDLLRKVRAHKPDVAVIDVRMPPGEGTEGMRAALAIHREMPDVGILMFSGYVEARCLDELLAAGAAGVGYMLKARVDEVGLLADAVRRVAAGETVLDPDVVAEIVSNRDDGPLETLTPRELEVLGLMAQGRSNRAIAALLFVSERVVERHVTSIFVKLGLPTSDQDHRRVLAVLAYLRDYAPAD